MTYIQANIWHHGARKVRGIVDLSKPSPTYPRMGYRTKLFWRLSVKRYEWLERILPNSTPDGFGHDDPTKPSIPYFVILQNLGAVSPLSTRGVVKPHTDVLLCQIWSI